MENLQAFSILGIDITKDERVIKSAYRMALTANNPEENPEGFKLLREAYEAALSYAATTDEDQYTIEDGTVMGLFKKALNELYMDFESRMTLSKWEELLNHEVFDDLEYSDEAKWVLFSYLSEYFRVKFEVYRLLDERFDVIENEKEFKERLPEGFVDYIIRCIKDTDDNDEFSYKWIKGKKNADYDKYISELIEFFERVERKDYEKIDDLDSLVTSLDMSGIWHPYHDVYKAKYLFEKRRIEEAVAIAKAFLKKPECEESVRSHTVALEVIFDSGEEEFAKDEFLKLTESVKGLYVAEKCLMKYYNDRGQYFEALEHYNNAMRYYGNQELAEEGKKIDACFVEKCREKIKTEILEEKEANQFAYSLLHINALEEGIEFLTSNEEHYEKMDDYHKLLAAFYAGLKDIKKVLSEADKYIENQDRIIEGKENNEFENSSEETTGDETEEELKKKEEEKKNKIIDAKYEKAWAISLKARMYHVKYRSFMNDENMKERRERWDARKKALEYYLEADSVIENNINIKRNIISFATDVNMQQIAYDYCMEYLKEYPNEYSALYELQRACVELHKGQEVIDLHFRLNEMYNKDPYVYTRAIVTFLYYHQIDDAKEVIERAKAAGAECFLLEVLEAEIEFEEIIYSENHTKDDLKAVLRRFNDIINETEKLFVIIRREKDRQKLDEFLQEKIYAMAEIYYMRARILVDSNEDNKKVYKELRKAITINDRRKYHMLIASLADEDDDAELAVKELEFIGEEYGYEIDVYGKLAHAAAILPLNRGGDKVFEYIEKAKELGADSNYAHRMFAETYYRYAWNKKKYEYLNLSNEHWKRVYEITPEDTAEATYYIARNMNLLGDYQNAYRYAHESDNAQPTESAKRMLSTACIGLGKYNEAINLFYTLSNSSEDAFLKSFFKLNVAKIYARMGEYDKAVAGYDEYLDSVVDKSFQNTMVKNCMMFGKFDDARRLAKKHLDYCVYADEIAIGYSYFFEARDINTLKKAEQYANTVIEKCKKDNCDCDEHELAKALANELLADILIYKKGNVFEGLKKKYAASRIIQNSNRKGRYDADNRERYMEMLMLAYETCDHYRFDEYMRRVKRKIINYSSAGYVDKAAIECYTTDAYAEGNETFLDTCYVVKYLCYEGRHKEAEELIRNRLSRPEIQNFVTKAEAESARLETLGVYFETLGDEQNAMRYFAEENRLYGMSKVAMLKVYGIITNKYDSIRKRGQISGQIVKMIRAEVNISDEKSYLELVYVRPSYPKENTHYYVYEKYYTSQVIIPLSQGELLRMLSNNYQFKGKYIITAPEKLETLKRMISEQAILGEEINTMKTFNKELRNKIAMLLYDAIKDGSYEKDIPILETYYQGEEFTRYGINYRFIKGSRMDTIVERVAYDIVHMYDDNLQGSEMAVKRYKDYE